MLTPIQLPSGEIRGIEKTDAGTLDEIERREPVPLASPTTIDPVPNPDAQESQNNRPAPSGIQSGVACQHRGPSPNVSGRGAEPLADTMVIWLFHVSFSASRSVLREKAMRVPSGAHAGSASDTTDDPLEVSHTVPDPSAFITPMRDNVSVNPSDVV